MHGPKIGGCARSFLRGGELGPHLTQCGFGRGLHPYQVASLSIPHFATTDTGPKLELCPHRGAVAPSNTMWSGPRPTCIPSGILIHPIVWPQYTNVTDRQERQDRLRSDDIGRTVSGSPIKLAILSMAESLQKRQDGDISQMLNVGDAMVGGERKKGEESGRGGEGMREGR